MKFAGNILIALICLLLLASAAWAEQILRDSETETFLKQQSSPIFNAAGIAPDSVRFTLIADPAINAFVAGGQNIFIYSGLIYRTENLSELLGVIAHETGHIVGGHLLKMEGVIESASRQSILYTLLGIAAGIASRSGEVAAAGSGLSNQALLSSILAHSRANEDSADEAGLRFLDKANIPATGMQSFLGKLMDEELLPASRQDEYVRTHPLTRDRYESVKRRVTAERDTPPISAKSEEQYQRIKAKLKGYLMPRELIRQPVGTDIVSRYGRAVALYRLDDMPGALKLVAALEAEEPQNPFFAELRGQILLDRGKIPESVAAYQKAVGLLQDDPLIAESYAQALLANEQPQAAIPVLNRAIDRAKDSPSLRHLLALAYGRTGKINEAQLELAEESLLNLNYKEAKYRAKGAKFPNGSPGALRAADIMALANDEIEKRQDNDKPSRH